LLHDSWYEKVSYCLWPDFNRNPIEWSTRNGGLREGNHTEGVDKARLDTLMGDVKE